MLSLETVETVETMWGSEERRGGRGAVWAVRPTLAEKLLSCQTVRLYQCSVGQLHHITPLHRMTPERGDARLVIRARSNSEVGGRTTAKSRCGSVVLPSYQRYYSDTSPCESRDKFNIQPNHRSNASKRKSRLSSFSFRSRASSVSSFSSGSSGSSSPATSPTCGTLYNTEIFWNQYRRHPGGNPVTNLIRRSRLRNLMAKDRKCSSTLDLYSSVM